jgi:hypothetical protein
LQFNGTKTLRLSGVALRRLAIFTVLVLAIALNLIAGSYSGVSHAHDHKHEHVAHLHHGDDHGHDDDHGNDVNIHHVESSEADVSLASGFAGCEQDCGGMLHEHACCIVLALFQPVEMMMTARNGAWNPSAPSFELTGPRTTFERPPRA